ncbi:hypothetical protein NL676_024370 [Syzygium grande]|nr:hypothetical protein NL676_024370 [Syzygium grande]
MPIPQSLHQKEPPPVPTDIGQIRGNYGTGFGTERAIFDLLGGAFSRVCSRSDAGQACLPYRGIGEWSERSKSGPLLSLRHAFLWS